MAEDEPQPKPVRWIGSSREDLRAFPEPVRLRIGGAGVLEVVDDHDGDTCRAVCAVRFAGVVHVLHAFQKKSRSGIATPRHEIALIEQRLKRGREDHEQWLTGTKTTSR